jgi:hypothetical protein
MLSPEDAGQRNTEPTRQQLDELDALMQRMLALPVTGTEEADPAPTSSQPVATAQPFDERTSPQDGDEWAETAAPVFEDFRFEEAPPVRRPAPASKQPEPALAVGSLETEQQEPIMLSPPQVRPTIVVAARGLQPLLWCNQVYDLCTMPLGGMGRWLRGENARALLGWMGIILLAAAFAWVAVEGIGWIW